MAKSPRAWSLATVLALLLGAATIATPAQARTNYVVKVVLVDDDENAYGPTYNRWTETIDTTTGLPEGNVIEYSSDGKYKLTISFKQLDAGHLLASFNICERNENTCDDIANPSMTFSAESPAVLEFGGVRQDPQTQLETPYNWLTITIENEATD